MSAEPTRSRENTRARLLEAAAEVFAEVGIGGTSVEAICERAGFTRGAFYSNFETKDQLFLELSDSAGRRQLERVRQRISELEQDPTFAEDDDFDSLLRVLDTLGATRDDMILMAESEIRAMRDEAFGAALLKQNERFIAEVTAIVEQVVQVRRLTLRVDATTAARLMMAAWESTARASAIARTPQEERNRACHETVVTVAQALIA
ncbi:TetR/AcrR family transcriptional regulator [Microbacterium halotolerans]|uniref:TetR/AcrR family transcriptional regulator n=1 Tax=Microbacterium halotolerans TaxID=246613 RepID=UPI000E6AD4AD|nr:TetR/AcrR family transcriptional regulator [Microbacterium halotolerans]